MRDTLKQILLEKGSHDTKKYHYIAAKCTDGRILAYRFMKDLYKVDPSRAIDYNYEELIERYKK